MRKDRNGNLKRKVLDLVRIYSIIGFAFSGSVCIATFNVAAYIASTDDFISKYMLDMFIISVFSPVIYFVVLDKFPKSKIILNKIYTISDIVLSYASIWLATYIVMTIVGQSGILNVTNIIMGSIVFMALLSNIIFKCNIDFKNITAISFSIAMFEYLWADIISSAKSFFKTIPDIKVIISIVIVALVWWIVNRYILDDEEYLVKMGLEMVESGLFLLYIAVILDMAVKRMNIGMLNNVVEIAPFIITPAIFMLVILSFKSVYKLADWKLMIVSSVMPLVYILLYKISGGDSGNLLMISIFILGVFLAIAEISLSDTMFNYIDSAQNNARIDKIVAKYKLLIRNSTILFLAFVGDTTLHKKEDSGVIESIIFFINKIFKNNFLRMIKDEKSNDEIIYNTIFVIVMEIVLILLLYISSKTLLWIETVIVNNVINVANKENQKNE